MLSAQEMRIGLLRTIKMKSVEVSVHDGSYYLYGDTSHVFSFRKGAFHFSANGVRVRIGDSSFVFKKCYLIQERAGSSLLVKSISPNSKEHLYQDNMEFVTHKSQLNLVNLVDMNNYLSGVIESEGGGGRHIEYYKVQALMSRTYALKNLNRHAKEGFQLCDGVHCQAYHNMLRHTPSIREAVAQTTGEVIVDTTGELVATYFSANCGGQTCEPSFIWNNSEPFLQMQIDTFCVHTRQARWTQKVSKSHWKQFLEKKYGVHEAKYGDLLYNFDQHDRKAFYIHPSLGIPLRDLRHEFKLKSTYFSTRLENEWVVIEGRGFGHGVGLCQEGAMNMAKLGYSYRQIALFYFHNVRIINAYARQFFNQSGSM